MAGAIRAAPGGFPAHALAPLMPGRARRLLNWQSACGAGRASWPASSSPGSPASASAASIIARWSWSSRVAISLAVLPASSLACGLCWRSVGATTCSISDDVALGRGPDGAQVPGLHPVGGQPGDRARHVERVLAVEPADPPHQAVRLELGQLRLVDARRVKQLATADHLGPFAADLPARRPARLGPARLAWPGLDLARIGRPDAGRPGPAIGPARIGLTRVGLACPDRRLMVQALLMTRSGRYWSRCAVRMNLSWLTSAGPNRR